MEPVILTIAEVCPFKRKPKNPKTGKKQLGCANCGKPKAHRDHMGTPPSFNLLYGSRQAYHAAKDLWQELFVDLLEESELPKGLGSVSVEGHIIFSARGRGSKLGDSGNFRVIPEKALGDALQQTGHLDDDGWDRYDFGRLTRGTGSHGSTTLVLFPSAERLLG